MQKETQKNYLSDQQIIEAGKRWMKESKDPCHDYEHAETVEKHSIQILKEYQSKNNPQFADTDENLVRIAAWWHDCYKATQSKSSFYSVFNEGVEAAKIFRMEFEGKMERSRLKLVAEAIEGHNKVWKFRFKINKINPVLRVLLEADGVETIVSERAAKQTAKDSLLYKVFSFFVKYGLICFYLVYPFSAYAKAVFHSNLGH